MSGRIVFHIDANSAYLSWTAVEMLKNGGKTDIRRTEAAIAGDPRTRRGVILAKSEKAKARGVRTGESIVEAMRKCPGLKLYAPDHEMYSVYSDAMYGVLTRYSPLIERFSIDECYLDYTGSESLFGPPLEAAHKIRNEIKSELGFTVNIGVSTNKILAKMASEREKPDKVHTIFPDEIESKMWCLPIGELFSVGYAARSKLESAGIKTIGDAARAGRKFLTRLIGEAHGTVVYNYANGIDDSPVIPHGTVGRKGIGNSTTTATDVKTEGDAHTVLLGLSEKLGTRLRKINSYAKVISVSMRPSDLSKRAYGHQRKLDIPICSTDAIYAEAKSLFRESWKGDSLRGLGISFSEITDSKEGQLSMFGDAGDLTAQSAAQPIDATIGDIIQKSDEAEILDRAVDSIRERYGNAAIKRGGNMS